MEKIALATKHQKEKLLVPIFQEKLDWLVQTATVDTDLFGTFSGDVLREKSPKETAIAKAKAGALNLGLSKGLASEGSIGPHPQIPFITADVEWIAYVDLEQNIELAEYFVSTEIVAVQKIWTQELDLAKLIAEADLPNHALIAKANHQGKFWSAKSLTNPAELNAAIASFQELAWPVDLILESDYRAMHSPSRQKNITQAANKLAERLATNCPACSGLGFGLVGHKFGLPCTGCSELATEAISADRFGCLFCSEVQVVSRGITSIDPANCQICNP
ncbi:unannotated protein [freshwater metagenome]|uniref:Unannotated protein n=1 Tax=freshwater metagenome TaxID=449393 RepID=A0A6J6EKZ0_9ZZZZ|nr:hypothetical protein [Actinomycetota bacterium]